MFIAALACIDLRNSNHLPVLVRRASADCQASGLSKLQLAALVLLGASLHTQDKTDAEHLHMQPLSKASQHGYGKEAGAGAHLQGQEAKALPVQQQAEDNEC